MRIARWVIPFVLAAAGLPLALRLPARMRALAPKPKVPTLRVEPDTFVIGLTSERQVEGCNDTFVMPQGVTGKIAYICEDGSHVEPGDVIARLDTKDLVRRLDDARLAYSTAQARVAQDERTSKTEVETARNALDQAKRELEVMVKANATELEGSQKELEHKRLQQESARLDYERQKRLASPEVGLVSRQQVEQAERALRSADFAVTTAEKALEFMQKQHQSQVEQKQNELTNAEYKLKTAEAAVKPAADAARYSIESTKQRVDRATLDLEQATIKAPCAGTVVLAMYRDRETRTSRPFKAGDDVQPGRRIATITDLSCLEVNLLVEESRIAPVKEGQEVLMTFDAIPGRTYRGTVKTLSASARRGEPWDDPTQSAQLRYFTVTVPIKNPDSRLRPGLKCRARIVFGRLPNVLVVPSSALVRRAGHDYVFVRHNGAFERHLVRVGERSEESVVIARGLKAGDEVALQDPTAQSQNGQS